LLFSSRTVIDTTTSTLSSTASSQDSLNRQQKKKGLKGSLGRLFSGKKEKTKHKGGPMSREIPPGKFICFLLFFLKYDKCVNLNKVSQLNCPHLQHLTNISCPSDRV